MREFWNSIDWLEGRVIEWLIVKPGTVVLIALLALVVRWLIHRAIDRLVRRVIDGQPPAFVGNTRAAAVLADLRPGTRERREQRASTMGSLLKSIATGIVAGVAVLMALDVAGLPIGPLLASAGVLGLAIGFGAQTLIKDFLAGVFMILEDQYGVGDSIDLGEASGTVEAVGLRVTRLRDVNGTVWYVRNGEVLRVGNQSQNWARSVLDVTVTYDADIEQVQRVLKEVAEQVATDPQFEGVVIEPPEVWGVERFDPDGVVVRVVLKTAPLKQWLVARTMRERIKVAFDAAGIQMPTSFLTATRGDAP